MLTFSELRKKGTRFSPEDVIFSCVHHQSWEGPLEGSPEEQARRRLHIASEAYAQALMRAPGQIAELFSGCFGDLSNKTYWCVLCRKFFGNDPCHH